MNKTAIALVAVTAIAFCGCERQPETQQNRPSQPAKEVTWEEKVEVPMWAATLVQRFRGPESSDDITLDVELIDREGNKKILARNILGPIVVFERDRVVASCEAVGALAMGTNPIFMSLSGETKNGPTHKGFVGQCSRIEGAELLLIKYNETRSDGKPYSLARIIDTTGALMWEKEFDGAGTLEFRHKGKTYKVDFPAPELPG